MQGNDDAEGLFTLEHPGADNEDQLCANCLVGIYSTRRKALDAAAALGIDMREAWDYVSEFELNKTYMKRTPTPPKPAQQSNVPNNKTRRLTK